MRYAVQILKKNADKRSISFTVQRCIIISRDTDNSSYYFRFLW